MSLESCPGYPRQPEGVLRLDVLSQLLDNDRIKRKHQASIGEQPASHAKKKIAEMSATMVPDYYSRLGVDPRAERAEIEAGSNECSRPGRWGREIRRPGMQTSFISTRYPPCAALLSDPASRAAYDADLAMVQVAEREQKLDILLRRVKLRAAKGGLTATDRHLLGDEATRLGLSEEDLLRLTRPIPELFETVVIDEDADLDADPPSDVLDPSTRRQIRAALDHLGCRDLYDALGVGRDSPVSFIASRADAERQRWMKKAQVTAEKTAWLEVITHAQSHLTSAKIRSRYDRTLAQEAEESFEALANLLSRD